MQIPGFTKGWQMTGSLGSTLCVPVASGNFQWLLATVAILTAFTSFPYAVVSCSNAVSVAPANLWLTVADVVLAASAGQPRSWIVLRNPATGTSYLWHALQVGGSAGEAYISASAGFTGGSTTTRPTAIDEVQYDGLFSAFNVNGGGTAPSPRTVCVWHTSDGQQTMLLAHSTEFSADALVLQMFFGNVHNAPPAWTHPTIFGAAFAGRGGVSAHALVRNGSGCFFVGEKPGGGICHPMFWAHGLNDGGGSDPISDQQPFANEMDGVRDAHPFGVYAQDSGFTGLLGVWPDLLGYARTNNEAWTVGGAGDWPKADKSRSIIGRLVYPWDPAILWVT